MSHFEIETDSTSTASPAWAKDRLRNNPSHRRESHHLLSFLEQPSTRKDRQEGCSLSATLGGPARHDGLLRGKGFRTGGYFRARHGENRQLPSYDARTLGGSTAPSRSIWIGTFALDLFRHRVNQLRSVRRREWSLHRLFVDRPMVDSPQLVRKSEFY